MTRNGEITFADAKRVFRGHWWIPPAEHPRVCLPGLFRDTNFPKKYTSTTSVLVEQPEVSADYVRPVVTTDLNQRLTSMKAQLLSSSRLQPIIDKFNLYPGLRGKVDDEVLVREAEECRQD